MSYYDIGDVETISIIKAKLTIAEYTGFCKGNIIKYITRAGYKTPDPSSDYIKAEFYLLELIKKE